MPKRVYKNPFSGRKFKKPEDCYLNTEINNGAQLDALGITAAQAVFNVHNGYPINKRNGRSVISGRATEWNERARRYERFANNKEREEYRKIFVARMQAKHGKTHLLNDPDMQKKMLANRKISGTYKFLNGKEATYTGSYEHDFLEFMDITLEWNADDIHMPAPKAFEYIGTDKQKHFYIPDAWIESLNIYVEIKSTENQHYRKRDIGIERQKDEMMQTSKNYYFKIEDMKYVDFIDYITSVINQEI